MRVLGASEGAKEQRSKGAKEQVGYQQLVHERVCDKILRVRVAPNTVVRCGMCTGLQGRMDVEGYICEG